MQIRRSLALPKYRLLRNGTTAQITRIDASLETIELDLGDERLTLSHEQANQADLRLAYVQHPFPAQGQTTDTAQLIIGEHATKEGSYVALTRARAKTHLYAPVNRPGVVGDFWPWKRGRSYANRTWSWKVDEQALFG